MQNQENKKNSTDRISDEEIAEVLLHTIQMQVVSDEVLRKYVTKGIRKTKSKLR